MAILTKINPKTSYFLFLHETNTHSQLIYITTLLGVTVAIIILPFLHTTISIVGTGAIQTNIERTEILAPASGRILEFNIKDNQKVNKGQMLLTIDATLHQKQKKLIDSQLERLEQHLSDALLLLRSGPRVRIQTPLYADAWEQYIEALQSAANARDYAFKNYQRYKILIDKNVITQAEFEQQQLNYKQTVSDFEMVIKRFKTQWQNEANQYRDELRSLKNQNIQIEDQVKHYVLNAPVNGSIQNLTGLQSGTYVYANQKLGEISPDSMLLAICYIKPSDIGLISKFQPVHLQVDAFNYNQWGILLGTVVDIADDITIQNDNAYFKVICKLNKNYLQLKNGYRGKIKKGLTLKARFIVSKRSFYQLLYDSIDDWLNPIQGA